MRLFEIVKQYVSAKPRVKKIIGVALIVIGLTALLTPLTPGSWLALIGLELLGVRLASHQLKFWK